MRSTLPSGVEGDTDPAGGEVAGGVGSGLGAGAGFGTRLSLSPGGDSAAGGAAGAGASSLLPHATSNATQIAITMNMVRDCFGRPV